MIGWIQGLLREKHPPRLLLDVRGVGYEIEAPMTTFYDLPAIGEEVTLFTHHLVREDAQQLFGFLARNERDVFRSLLKVNGVGAKVALTILSGMDAIAFGHCVREGDTASLSKLPGIGKKTAERLVVEMRDRLAPAPEVVTLPSSRASDAPRPDARHEAVSALVALGLKPQEASKRVQSVDGDELVCEEIVRRALQSMVR